MSQEQSVFIRRLTITLVSTLGPLILTGLILTGINLQRINTNEKHIEALESSRMSKEMTLAYVDELRNLIKVMEEGLRGDCDETKKQVQEINDRIDALIQYIYMGDARGRIPTEVERQIIEKYGNKSDQETH